jgi:hypothetical protein
MGDFTAQPPPTSYAPCCVVIKGVASSQLPPFFSFFFFLPCSASLPHSLLVQAPTARGTATTARDEATAAVELLFHRADMVSHRPCHFAPLSPLLPLVLTPQPPPHHPIQVDAAAGPSQHARPWAQFGPVPFNPFLFLICVFKSQKLDQTSKIHR